MNKGSSFTDIMIFSDNLKYMNKGSPFTDIMIFSDNEPTRCTTGLLLPQSYYWLLSGDELHCRISIIVHGCRRRLLVIIICSYDREYRVVYNADYRYPDVAFICMSKEYCSTADQGPFHSHFGIQVMLIVEDPTVTVKCRTAIQVLFLYFNLCLSIKMNSLSCSFTSKSFLLINLQSLYLK